MSSNTGFFSNFTPVIYDVLSASPRCRVDFRSVSSHISSTVAWNTNLSSPCTSNDTATSAGLGTNSDTAAGSLMGVADKTATKATKKRSTLSPPSKATMRTITTTSLPTKMATVTSSVLTQPRATTSPSPSSNDLVELLGFMWVAFLVLLGGVVTTAAAIVSISPAPRSYTKNTVTKYNNKSNQPNKEGGIQVNISIANDPIVRSPGSGLSATGLSSPVNRNSVDLLSPVPSSSPVPSCCSRGSSSPAPSCCSSGPSSSPVVVGGTPLPRIFLTETEVSNRIQEPATDKIITTRKTQYKCISCLGSGAFGAVWLAEELQTQVRCAIKFTVQQGAKGLQQIAVEGFVQSTISTLLPSVTPKVIDSSLGFMVTECVEGSSLNELIGEVSKELTKWWCYQILVSFRKLRQIKWLHGDVKPDNFMVCKQTASVLPIDWGKALSLCDAANLKERDFSVSDRKHNANWYMAIEQCSDFDEWGAPTAASEIWSVACLVCILFDQIDLNEEDIDFWMRIMSALVPLEHQDTCEHQDHSLELYSFLRPPSGCTCQAPQNRLQTDEEFAKVIDIMKDWIRFGQNTADNVHHACTITSDGVVHGPQHPVWERDDNNADHEVDVVVGEGEEDEEVVVVPEEVVQQQVEEEEFGEEEDTTTNSTDDIEEDGDDEETDDDDEGEEEEESDDDELIFVDPVTGEVIAASC
eukprot:TRINITY_DN66630_c3_g1_i2.p1 TRINITY_DN66630_c3_g1~~TRINITY_DN66630_c3_g1_i2.p1  ORF type:complete len:695 (+),score=114.20 TRINITY_DN66630_c3_g1_i2:207-2291(+)